ncbi:hypothetical protein TVAG_442190 [Trichomonas vaginalis G3]|uniref:Helicase ATP-binding domain-containing protein n=1 Tax=Trichomonas vaginalis (strain ATCC PRA-98 / G3) TaxID=412133 RepID=A2F1W2_TRIV3|nr:DNA repair DEAD helicase RAD3/XP-D subfamily member family [Trichomonas vaginalis G3]EAY01107.1 hypothetical protein TVAG_442190 [Trichomonas vaginalis G3]KAI5517424.1 DNA repair DEAD helicase RAD3/XP-D subfamily member family [Trichomonas vaginalis G3]|eukprot:XP_001313959.1 hypothetical protein [Trichomonas vaginalis G3]
MTEGEKQVYRVQIVDLQVIFPYRMIYSEQKSLMEQIKLSLDARGPFVFETPPGIGKLIAVFSIYLEYLSKHPDIGPIVYSTDTYQSYLRAFEAFQIVVKAREADPDPFNKSITAISLGSKHFQCINKTVKESDDIEDLCFNNTCSWSRTHCDYFGNVPDQYQRINSIDSFNEFCKECNACPYYASRAILHNFKVIFISNSELLNPKSPSRILQRLPDTASFIFDNSHYLDKVCCDNLSSYLTLPLLEQAKRELDNLKKRVESTKNDQKSQDQYENVAKGIKIQDILDLGPKVKIPEQDGYVYSTKFMIPIVPSHQTNRNICGTLWNMDHFLFRVDYLLKFLVNLLPCDSEQTFTKYSSTELLTLMYQEIFTEPLALYFMGPRLSYYIASEGIDQVQEFAPLYAVFNFCSLLATYNESLSIVADFKNPIEAHVPIASLQLSCHDASLAFSMITDKFQNFFITSSALLVPGFFPVLLGFKPLSQIGMVYSPRDEKGNYNLNIMTISHGNDQQSLVCSPNDVTTNIGIVRNIMALLIESSKATPDGMVVFFPSFKVLNTIVTKWRNTNQQVDLLNNKLIFIEQPDPMKASLLLDSFYRSLDNMRGGILMCVAGGIVADALDLSNHHCRTAIAYGFPMMETYNDTVELRADYLDKYFQFPTTKFIKWNSLRNVIASLDTILSSKSDFATILLADKRYSESEILNELLPAWMQKILTPDTTGQGVEEAKETMRKFFYKAHSFKPDPTYRIDLSTQKN